MFNTLFFRIHNKRYPYSNLRIVILFVITSVVLSFLSCRTKNVYKIINHAIEAQENGHYQEACNYYEQAINADPENSLKNHDEIYNKWGDALSILAKINYNEDLYESSIEKYKKAIDLKYKKATELNPNDSEAYLNWGMALANLALKDNNKDLYESSIEKYKKATELDPNYSEAYLNWGMALANLALKDNNKELYESSIEKYKKAIELKYKKAIELNPNDSEAYNNWGAALSGLARLENNIEKYKNDIFEVLLKAEKLEEGSGAYNLACLHSLLNEKDLAFNYLNAAFRLGHIPDRDYIEKDKDLDNLNSDPRFEELLNKYFPKNKN